MKLQSLAITNFKNIADARLEFSPRVNCFLGDNGMGKSNLLDAIYYLSFCRSFAGLPDPMLMRRGESFAMLSGHYRRGDADEEISAGLQDGRRKSFRRGGKEYKRLSSHIGLFPLVLIAPSDQNLVSGLPEERRRFIDMVVAQSDPRYLQALIRYTEALEQRNRLLREGSLDHALFEAVEMQMEMSSAYVMQARCKNIAALSDHFAAHYAAIAGEHELPTLEYKSSADPGQSLAAQLDHDRDRDRLLRHTSVGPHRDDMEMTLSGMPVRRVASQGQSKTFTIALRLAQYDFLRQATGFTPMLLLDDVFDKLDRSRVERIMNLVTSDAFGQTFITDTNRDHLDDIMARTGGDYRMWLVDDGRFMMVEHTMPEEGSAES